MQTVLFTALTLLNGFLVLGWMIAVLLPIVSIGLIFLLNLFPFVFGDMSYGHDLRDEIVVNEIRQMNQVTDSLLAEQDKSQDKSFACAQCESQTMIAQVKMVDWTPGKGSFPVIRGAFFKNPT
jgi:hypothetical protein